MRQILLCSLLSIILSQFCFAQGETTLTFLQITTSPTGNGMGGIVGSTITDDPMAVLANPGQLGLQSFDHTLTTGFYPSGIAWLPQFQQSDLNLNATAVNLGMKVNDFLFMSFPVTVGVSYSNTNLNLGSFAFTSPTGNGIEWFDAHENTKNVSFGIGFNYFVKVGIGYTMKNIVSDLAPITTGFGQAAVSSTDFGVVVQAPVIGIIDQMSGSQCSIWRNENREIDPLFDLSFGYARRNLGDQFVWYGGPTEADPMPREATIGLTYKAGLVLHKGKSSWELFSVKLAREAADILVTRLFSAPLDSNGFPVGNPPPQQYVNGIGAINILDNVVLGEGNGHSQIRKGWQISAGEFVEIRGGSVDAPGLVYTTTGWGLRLSGLVKLFTFGSERTSESSFVEYIYSHLDVRYDHASESGADNSPRDGNTYDGVSVLWK